MSARSKNLRPLAGTFTKGELLEVTYGHPAWAYFWEKHLKCKGAVSGYLLKDIDAESGIPAESKAKPIKVGTIVMYVGLNDEAGTKGSLVGVLYQEQVVAIMWKCLIKAKKGPG